MTIADDPPNSQQETPPAKTLEKSLDAVAALRQAMERRLAAAPPVKPPEEPPPPPPAAGDAPPQPEPQAEKRGKAEKTAAPQSPISFDPVEWTQILLRVAEKSRDLIRAYVERTADKPSESPAFTPMPVLESWAELSSRILNDPEAYTQTQLTVWQNYLDITRASLLRLQGMKAPDIATPPQGDKRFQSTDWQSNWAFDAIKQSYLATSDEARRLVRQETAQLDEKLAKKIDFYTRLFLDATAPSNFWLTNPEVLRATLDSRGDNLIKGLENLLTDLERGNGMLQIRMSDFKAFEIGKNIATAPGQVIYQNDLMQLIQYAPSTPTARRVPLLILPPWINKFYILDLREKNSLIRYLVGQGFTVFCVSWINPTKRHALTQFEDYLDKGALAALREVRRATGEDTVNVAGYCIGGTLLACLLAHFKAAPPDDSLPRIVSATYLTTMIDFGNPGDLGVFIDEEQVRVLEERMARQGFMDAGSLMMTFNLLRANDLIWPFVINNYMLGREPFPFDILYWNTDSTNLPAAMQSYYLRKMYMENKLIVPNALRMKNTPLDLTQIDTPSFLLSTREDHIAPWRSTYASTQLYKGPVTFVLAGSGHIAGVINPPASDKYSYWTNAALPADPEDWFKDAAAHKGSWWPEWMNWLMPYAGEEIPARAPAEGLEPAPGSYVKARAV